MYVTSVSINDIGSGVSGASGAGETYREVTVGLVEDLIRRLDGIRHTTVTLNGTDGAVMSIGGRASEGLVVFENRSDSYHFLSGTNIVSLAAGNVRDQGHLVDLDRAIKAAREFTVTGKLAGSLVWQAF